MSWLDEIRAHLAERRLRRSTPPYRVTFDDVAVTRVGVWSNMETTSIRWADVDKAFAYKQDLYTADQICLVMVNEAQSRLFEVTEEYPGFPELLPALAGHLPGIAEDWYLRLAASPAFEPGLTGIYTRSADGGEGATDPAAKSEAAGM